ncbi:glycosyltransferase involved in cell wall biosynthesis [Dysgonomonas sp. PFB1-18]|uniref:glycogen/starch synthase n=1 Tax=unclassified Dysgonomonas TaxID=2630389 RepID=UPI002473C5CF|nr:MULTISPECIES: glycogen/starch synthase [unclassified Dysgonomonas]MDH6307684.1 glycosyltransferase involved in cell wall biosynthesis [Dysgonomonas sp. PF1-14]MDH6337602.1 glycosyltransferase involved in cell wall biosynthesis [Dysgonomonas sp. PF1-16]MDH6378826.1 glycosyltransferase involved in cell wall biosynthesis [Dysgonomonas sp. PFB1-18]MDH6396461.1 glycosyltransferase involved in cell wall biosynthesis [Dysgonomonas sp. PF1-23]
MIKADYTPDYIFETSWEVCNKVGGIYTVLSTKAKSMQTLCKDRAIFIGPDVWTESESPWFKEDKKLFEDWQKVAILNDRLNVRVGRWLVPGEPVVILVKFDQFFPVKDVIYGDMWHKFGVDSLNAYGDYDESCMFAYATGAVIESFYKYYKLDNKKVVAHFNEWMLGMGALYIKDRLPRVGTLFTTHATSIGRSIAGNGKPLYNYLAAYDSDQMARELNMEAKHSVEKIAAQQVDCFTTVSDITARECRQLLHRDPLVTPNGFEKDFIPVGEAHEKKRLTARKKLINVAEKLLGYDIQPDALLVVTSGRYEYRNKGIDVFVDAMHRLEQIKQLEKDVIAFIMVPAWIDGPRADLQERLKSKKNPVTPLSHPHITHWLRNMNHDSILNQIDYLNMENKKEDKVKIIFVPSYLNGSDGIFDMPYYDLLIGMDVSVFPSYYEPWGYTPHESIAFSVPTITTSLAGFGLWMRKMGDERGMDDGAEVLTRDDYNFIEVSEDICNRVFEMATKSNEQEKILRKAALDRAALADWSHFYQYYKEAYTIALKKAGARG